MKEVGVAYKMAVDELYGVDVCRGGGRIGAMRARSLYGKWAKGRYRGKGQRRGVNINLNETDAGRPVAREGGEVSNRLTLADRGVQEWCSNHVFQA